MPLLRRWRQPSLAWLVFFVIVVDLIGFGIVIPILPFLSPQLGGGTDDIAFILVSYSVAAALVAPLWGRLSDRLGRRRVLGICLLGGAASHFLLAAADTLSTVYLARAVAGAMAGSLPVATALVADVSAPDRRSRAMGLIGRAFGVGLVLGPMIGGLLSLSDGDFTIPCLVAGGLSTLAAVMAFLLLPEHIGADAESPAAVDPEEPEARVDLIRRPGLLLFVSQFTFHTCAVSASIYLFPLWVADGLGWQAREVGLFFGLVGAVMIMTQGNLLGRMTDLFGPMWVLRGAAAGFCSALLFSAYASDPWAMGFLGLAAFSVATLCLPLLNTIASQLVTASRRGQFFGITTSAAAMGRIVGPLLAALLLAQGSFFLAWLGAATAVFVVLVWSCTSGNAVQRVAGYHMGQTAPKAES